MNGAESLVHTLIAGGIDTVFANPGTSEMHFVAALDRIPGIRCVLCLDEGVVAGAADAYWRLAGKPAATLLHCGPGLGNALSNLHNARRARAGILNIVGDQATYHRPLDAPLTADTEGWARPVSGFVRTATCADRVGADAAAAIEAARAGMIATLILPADTAWDEGGIIAGPREPAPPAAVDAGVIARIASVLRSGEPTMLLLGGKTLRENPLAIAAGIAEGTGSKLLAEMFNARIERGRNRTPIERVPYLIDMALPMFEGCKNLILVESVSPVGFFAYPSKPGRLWPDDCTIHVLARPDQNGPGALESLAGSLAVRSASPAASVRPEIATGPVTPEGFARSLATLLPESAVIVDESISFGGGLFPMTAAAQAHDWIALTGGAIGDGIPMAVGAAIGAPGRRVVALQADGSAMYTIAGLWSAAREQLDITFIVLANRKYAILLHELAGVGANPGRTALDMLDIGRPDLDFVKLAEGMGVPGAVAGDLDAFNIAFAASVDRPGPFLIELRTG